MTEELPPISLGPPFPPPPTRTELRQLFGFINYSDSLPWPNNKPYWAYEGKHMSTYVVPKEIAPYLHNTATGRPTTIIYANKIIHKPLDRAFANLLVCGVHTELRTFDGCFCIRKIRGDDTQLSMHSYGLAIDLNRATNGLGDNPTFSDMFVKCWTHEGWFWGGDFKRKDGMHFEFVREPDPEVEKRKIYAAT